MQKGNSVMAWSTPKTDWTASDSFNIGDYNRIKNNLKYLHDESELIYGAYGITDMGSDISGYTGFWDVAKFNAFENNLQTINEHMIDSPIGQKMTFYPNGVFIGYAELNRIENATLTLKATIDGWYEAMATLPFRLGAKRALRV